MRLTFRCQDLNVLDFLEPAHISSRNRFYLPRLPSFQTGLPTLPYPTSLSGLHQRNAISTVMDRSCMRRSTEGKEIKSCFQDFKQRLLKLDLMSPNEFSCSSSFPASCLPPQPPLSLSITSHSLHPTSSPHSHSHRISQKPSHSSHPTTSHSTLSQQNQSHHASRPPPPRLGPPQKPSPETTLEPQPHRRSPPHAPLLRRTTRSIPPQQLTSTHPRASTATKTAHAKGTRRA